ncbi:hypothetical protein OFB62_31800, partial [Escherichia coli]|nr:hypothetical protein [Escherichia coli]
FNGVTQIEATHGDDFSVWTRRLEPSDWNCQAGETSICSSSALAIKANPLVCNDAVLCFTGVAGSSAKG